ncbi:MAG: hypothetical protein ABF868_08020 [Sporolactobacillus sp.]
MNVYGRSRLGQFMLIGSIAGGALSLLSRETRSAWGHRLNTAAHGGGRLIRTIYHEPARVGRYLSLTGTRIKGLSREIAGDFQQMVDSVEKAQASGSNTYQYVMEAGSELGEMAGKIKRYGQNMADLNEPLLVDSQQDAVARLEDESSLLNNRQVTVPRAQGVSVGTIGETNTNSTERPTV